jgi:hypothetical protein
MRVTGKMANPKAWVNKLSKMETSMKVNLQMVWNMDKVFFVGKMVRYIKASSPKERWMETASSIAEQINIFKEDLWTTKKSEMES